MEAPPLQRWLALRLRTLGLDDAVFAPYIQALLTEAAEGGGGQDGNVEATLASLCPPQQELQWNVFCRDLMLYHAHPHLLPVSVAPSPSSSASSPLFNAHTLSPSFVLRAPSSVSATSIGTVSSPSSSTSPTASPSLLSSSSRVFVPKHHQQEPPPHYHLPRLDDDDPFSFDNLSAQVASSCLGGDDDDEEEDEDGLGHHHHSGGVLGMEPQQQQQQYHHAHIHQQPNHHLAPPAAAAVKTAMLHSSPSLHPQYHPHAQPYVPQGHYYQQQQQQQHLYQQQQQQLQHGGFTLPQLQLHRSGSGSGGGGGGAAAGFGFGGAGGGLGLRSSTLSLGGGQHFDTDPLGEDDGYGGGNFQFLDEEDEEGEYVEDEDGREGGVSRAMMMAMVAAEEEEAYMRDAALGVLMGAFPHCSPDALLVALLRCDFDLEEAVRKVDTALKPRVPACRYFLSGFCARSDCAFSHAIDKMTCIHWLLGSCRDGMLDEESKTPHECPFWHDVRSFDGEDGNPSETSSTSSSSSSSSSGPPFSANDETHFPALSASVSSSATTSAASSSSSSPSPSTTASTPGKSFLQVALASKRTSTPGRNPLPSSLPSSSSSSYTSSSSKSSTSSSSSSSRRTLESLWVMGGEEVRKTYLKARAEATHAAKTRNQYFMRATEAFQRGDKAAAKALGQEGRRWNATMKARHRAAALAIFASRNPSEKKIYEEGVLDLHGLHVAEATEAVEELLPDIFVCGKAGEVTLITGTGKHSGGVSRYQARLFPALESYLQELEGEMREGGRREGGREGALFESVLDPQGYAGGFKVRLSRKLMEYWGVVS